ncbi:MAG: hypothetical protein ACREHG_07055, partial [Candidatus Saccharimonadales bacterium]
MVGIEIVFLESRQTMTKIASKPDLVIGASIKSMERSCQGRCGIGKGFSNPGVLSRGLFVVWQTWQFPTY